MAEASTRHADLLGVTIRRLLRRGGRGKISRLLARERPETVAVSLRRLTPTEQIDVFQILVEDHPAGATEVLTNLEPEDRLSVLQEMRAETVGKLLKEAARRRCGVHRGLVAGVLERASPRDRRFG